VRSFNILKNIALENNVFLGTFIDDADDLQYIPFVKNFCKEFYFQEINKKISTAKSLLGFFKKTALTLNYYNSSGLHNWINYVVNNNKIDAVVVFSSAMAQYVDDDLYSRTLIDFVDVDSQKWCDYADQKSWPLSWIYKRESSYLLKYERNIASRAKHSFFVTEKETNLFVQLAPECFFKTSTLNNGVDSDYFSNAEIFPSPFSPNDDGELIIPIVFTGAMDYWPNIDAVLFFIENVFSVLIKKNSCYRFYVVGRNPTLAIVKLVSKFIIVTGTVKDVRPYLQHATVVVAPLRIARGIQNKILEAMSMQKPVVASLECVGAINAIDGIEIISAVSPEDYVKSIELISGNTEKAKAIGYAARANVVEKYSWKTHLKQIDLHLGFNNKY
jgi:sugar transferase (PEP-CTERM/EpsH1 system associated)